jgi:hypothetical protein
MTCICVDRMTSSKVVNTRLRRGRFINPTGHMRHKFYCLSQRKMMALTTDTCNTILAERQRHRKERRRTLRSVYCIKV